MPRPPCRTAFPAPHRVNADRVGEFELTRPGTGGTIKNRGLRLVPFLWLALAGCQKGEFAPDAKFVDLYVELKLATVGYANDLDKVNQIRRVILAQHQVTPSQFHLQTEDLMAHPGSWRRFQEEVVARVEAVQSRKDGPRAEGMQAKPASPAAKTGGADSAKAK